MTAGDSLQPWLNRADELGGDGRFFEAHEELEPAWHAAGGEAKILLQGLIQVAAGLHRLKRDPDKTAGAFFLLDRGLQKLRRARALLTPGSLDALERRLLKIRRSGTSPRRLRFGLRCA